MNQEAPQEPSRKKSSQLEPSRLSAGCLWAAPITVALWALILHFLFWLFN